MKRGCDVILNQTQIEAMDDTMNCKEGAHVIRTERVSERDLDERQTERDLAGRIKARQNILATHRLTRDERIALEEANEMDEQEICLREADRTAEKAATSLAWWVACVLAAVLFFHLAVRLS